jgi:hypothetical protein
MDKKCQFIKSNGERCKAFATKESGYKYCFFHSLSDEKRQELIEKRKQAVKDFSLKSEQGVLRLLAKLIFDVFEANDGLSIERAKTIGLLLDRYLKIKSEKTKREQKIRQLEREIEELRKELEEK